MIKGQICFIFFTLSSSSALKCIIFYNPFPFENISSLKFHPQHCEAGTYSFLSKKQCEKAVLRLGFGPSWLMLPWQQRKRAYRDQSQQDGLCSSRARIHLIKVFGLWVMVSVIVAIFWCHYKRKDKNVSHSTRCELVWWVYLKHVFSMWWGMK